MHSIIQGTNNHNVLDSIGSKRQTTANTKNPPQFISLVFDGNAVRQTVPTSILSSTILTECYKPNFFLNQSDRLAITNPKNTCSAILNKKKVRSFSRTLQAMYLKRDKNQLTLKSYEIECIKIFMTQNNMLAGRIRQYLTLIRK